MGGIAGRLCVAHLVRKANGVEALRDFLATYRAHDPGCAHRLLLILKGFAGDEDFREYEPLMEGLAHERVHVSDQGFDIGAYVAAAHRRDDFDRFAFLNSYSRIQRDGWLDGLVRASLQPGVGLAGATGSWQSVRTDFKEVDGFHPRHRMVFYKRWIIATDLTLRFLTYPHRLYPPFPNYHVRTNAFVVSRDQFRRIRYLFLNSKRGTYLFESGWASMTRQIQSAGQRTLVVGGDGVTYDPPEWVDSRTFWIHEQENLLVADNQTRTYAEGTPDVRANLAHHAWRRHPDGRTGSVFVDPWKEWTR